MKGVAASASTPVRVKISTPREGSRFNKTYYISQRYNTKCVNVEQALQISPLVWRVILSEGGRGAFRVLYE
jgi:hypothetical protein